MRKVLAVTGLAAVALAVAACGSSGGTAAAGSSSPPAVATSDPAPSSAAPSSPAPSSPASTQAGTTLSTRTIGGTVVLTNSKGRTLYWFAPDTSTTSKCTGSCATYWPPVLGPATAGSGVTGKLGTITRAGGVLQVTYDGHPLYTFAGDTAAGQAKGNRLDASGGLWYEMTASGATPAAPAAPAATQAPAAPAPATSSSSGGGGYGY